MTRAAILLVLLAGCVVDGGRDATAIRIAAGTPHPYGFVIESRADGQNATAQAPVVAHDVCLAVDTATGYLAPVSLHDDGFLAPVEGVEVQPSPVDGIDCPTGNPWLGWARMSWETKSGHGVAVIEHTVDQPTGSGQVSGSGSGSAASQGVQLILDGEAFPGFLFEPPPEIDHPPGDPTGTTVQVTVHVQFAATATLAARPADGAVLGLAWAGGTTPPTFLGGAPDFDMTHNTVHVDAHGDAFVLIAPQSCSIDPSSHVLFVTTPDGASQPVTTIQCL